MTTKKHLGLKISIIFASIIFILFAASISFGMTSAFDNSVYGFVSSFISDQLTTIAMFITHLGDTIVVVGVCVLLLIIPKTRIKFGLPVSATIIVSAILNTVIKHIFARPRPHILMMIQELDYSFPSGHAMNNMALYTMIALLLCYTMKNRSFKILVCLCASLFVLLIGFSRIYLGVHYASDVFAGFALGYVVAVCMFLLWEKRMVISDKIFPRGVKWLEKLM